MRYPLINNSFLEGFNELVLERGGNPAALFQAAGLRAETVTSVEALIPFNKHSTLMELAAKELSLPTIGLELASRQNIAIYGPLASMVVTSSTIGEALNIFIKHLQLRVQTVSLNLHSQKGLTELSVSCDFQAVAQSIPYQDHALALAKALLVFISGDPKVVKKVCIAHQAESTCTTPYIEHFCCPVAFDTPSLSLYFQSTILKQPISESAGTVPLRLRQFLEERHKDDLVEQVKYVTSILLTDQECSIAMVARAMGYSTRTLQRRLQEEGASFSGILDALRCSLATSYVGNSYYRLIDIAATLGYSELSAFTRSFKRWFGISPQQWRNESNSNTTKKR